MEMSFEKWTGRLFEIERDFYSAFSGVHHGEGFKAYHRIEYEALTDCNHAVLDLSNKYFRRPDIIATTLDEMEAFYGFVGLVPRLYQGFYEDEYQLLLPILTERGYQVETYKETELYVFDPTVFESDELLHAPIRQTGFVEVLTPDELKKGIFENVDGHDSWYELLGEMLESAKHRVFAGFENGEIVCIATAQYVGGFCRIDHVKTIEAYRCRGFCHGLMHFIMKTLVQEQPDALYYLYASKPEAIKPYIKSGFRKVEMKAFIWGAWKK